MKTSGIYKITSPSNRIYIGQSSNVKERFKAYKQLQKSKFLTKLYRSFLKYGIENHKFEIIEECSIESLNERERYWQECYNVLGEKGLNCKLSNTNAKNALLSDATKTKISKAHKGKILSKETKQKMSISKIGLKKNKCLKVINILNNTIYNSLKEAIEIENITYSLSYIKAMLCNIKHNKTNLRYLNRKDIPILEKPKHPRLGKKHTEESKQKISNTKRNKI